MDEVQKSGEHSSQKKSKAHAQLTAEILAATYA